MDCLGKPNPFTTTHLHRKRLLPRRRPPGGDHKERNRGCQGEHDAESSGYAKRALEAVGARANELVDAVRPRQLMSHAMV